MSNGTALGEFLYDANEHALRLPHGLGIAEVNFGFCSGTDWRYAFPPNTKAKPTPQGLQLRTQEFLIPPRIGHGGVVCYHRPPFVEGLTVRDVEGVAELERSEHGFDIRMSGKAREGIKNAFVHMKHFPRHVEILVPYLDGWSIQDIPAGQIHVFSTSQAFGWIYPFVIFQVDNVGMMIRFDDPSYGPKHLVLSMLEEEHGLQVSVYAQPTSGDAPPEWTSPSFKFESFQGGWEMAAKRYRDSLEFGRGLKPYRLADIPQRQRDICLLVNLRGHNWGPFIYNTFDQMGDRLKDLARFIEPRHCVAYIEGFDGGYSAPTTEFLPSPEQGGIKGFKKLINCAHELGYLIIPYLHTHCLTTPNPHFERFKEDAFTQWYTDTDGDGICELMLLNMRTDNAEWNEMILANLKRMFDSFDIDGVLLDEICGYTPSERTGEYIHGCREFLARVKEYMRPDGIIITEGLGEPYLDLVRMGMTPVHSRAYYTPTNCRGRDMLYPLEHIRLHPVVKYITNYFGRYVGHSSMRAAQEVEAHRYQAQNYSRLGIIPILNMHNAAESIENTPLHLATIARAKRIAEGIESLEYPE